MSTKRIAVFPGSFDPFTRGHFDIVERSAGLFDELVIAVGYNANKQGMFSVAQRLEMIEKACAQWGHVRTESYQGLTIDYCEKIGARYMLRGMRNTIDFEYEKSIAQMNASMNAEVETILLFTSPTYSAINASIVRDILRNEGNIEAYLPKGVVLPADFNL